MIYVVATLTVKPETRAEFIAGAKPVAASRKPARRPAILPTTCMKVSRSDQDGVRRAMGKRRGAGSAPGHRTHEGLRPHRREMHVLRRQKSRSLRPRRSTSVNQEKNRKGTSMIYVVATFSVKPEKSRDAFIKGAKECIAVTRKEKGCYRLSSRHTSINDPRTSSWWSRAGRPSEDLNAHGRAPHIKNLARIFRAAEAIADRDRGDQRRQGREAVSIFS